MKTILKIGYSISLILPEEIDAMTVAKIIAKSVSVDDNYSSNPTIWTKKEPINVQLLFVEDNAIVEKPESEVKPNDTAE